MLGFIFPGQGSQTVGMGRAFYEAWPVARRCFELADDICDAPISRFCFEGPQEELTKTERAQPALYTVCHVCAEYVRERGMVPAIVGGHSLGEYAALVAAGAMDFEAGMTVVAERGRLMAAAAEPSDGMAAVLGLAVELVREIIDTEADIAVANINCPGQTVISGTRAAIDGVTERLRDAGAKRVVPLAVSGAFHTARLREAAEALAPHINSAVTRDADVPVVQNATGKAAVRAKDIRDALVRQMTSPVLWQECVETMTRLGVASYAELGPGRVLKGLVERCHRGAQVWSVSEPEAVYELEERMANV